MCPAAVIGPPGREPRSGRSSRSTRHVSRYGSIAARVRQGGHNVPREDVLRRFERSRNNFLRIYRPMADRWSVYDNSGINSRLVERGP